MQDSEKYKTLGKVVELALVLMIVVIGVFLLLTQVRFEPEFKVLVHSRYASVWTKPGADYGEYGGKSRIDDIIQLWEERGMGDSCRIIIDMGSETYVDGRNLFLGPQDPTEWQWQALCQP